MIGMIYLAVQNDAFKQQIEYVWDLYFFIYGFPKQVLSYKDLGNIQPDPGSLVISYGRGKPEGTFAHQIHIHESPLFGANYLQPASLPKEPLPHYQDLPIIYAGNGDVMGWVVTHENERGGKTIETNIDIIASSFFMLTRYEEVVTPVQDKFERYPATASLAYREGFLDRPIVNEYIELLGSWVEGFNLGFERKELWDGKDFAVCLTHDVDVLRKYSWYPPLRAIAGRTLKHHGPRKSFAVAREYLRVRGKRCSDPYDQFDYLMQVSERYGVSSSFYFISGGETKYDNCYSIGNPYAACLVRHIRDRGFEVALHSSFNAFSNSQMLMREKERLEAVVERAVYGVRQHYLRWRTPDSWRVREEAGFKYDTTLTFADHEGFRCGICLPYKPFDVLANKQLDIWELPLAVMEGTLYDYQGLLSVEVFSRIKKLVDVVKKHNGLFIILCHNSSLDEMFYPGWTSVYVEILEYISKQNVLSDTALGIIRRWERV